VEGILLLINNYLSAPHQFLEDLGSCDAVSSRRTARGHNSVPGSQGIKDYSLEMFGPFKKLRESSPPSHFSKLQQKLSQTKNPFNFIVSGHSFAASAI
jgi:hypothetical protein